jgi:hypothetical protein
LRNYPANRSTKISEVKTSSKIIKEALTLSKHKFGRTASLLERENCQFSNIDIICVTTLNHPSRGQIPHTIRKIAIRGIVGNSGSGD